MAVCLDLSLVGSWVVVGVGLAGPQSLLVDDCGLQMALGSILGPEVLGVAGSEAMWNCQMTYLGSVWLGSTWEAGTGLDDLAGMHGLGLLRWQWGRCRDRQKRWVAGCELYAWIHSHRVFCWGTWSSLQEIW